MERISKNLIRCPECKNGYCSSGRNGKSQISCQVCKATFPIKDGYIDLVPDLSFERSVAQYFMESSPIVSIYESRFWRKSPMAAMALGVSFGKEAAIISNAVGLENADSLLDIACGPGIYTRTFAQGMGNGRAVGLDLSAPMLKWGAQQAKKQGVDNLVYVRASAMDLPFEDESFDAVNCCGALHLFPDTDKALDEVGRVLGPGGRFTVAAFRKGEGILGSLRAIPAKRVGVVAFTPKGLGQTLESRGFSGIHCHLDTGRWLVLSAVKQ